MNDVISHTPVYVWILLLYFVWSGLQARKTRLVSWKKLLIVPTIMLSWSIYGAVSIAPWAFSTALGCWAGAWTTRKLALRFDKRQKLIEIPGTWTPMVLSMAIFSLRYFLGATQGLHPELSSSPPLLVLEHLATLVSGMFAGRLIGYWRRSKTAPHVDIALRNP